VLVFGSWVNLRSLPKDEAIRIPLKKVGRVPLTNLRSAISLAARTRKIKVQKIAGAAAIILPQTEAVADILHSLMPSEYRIQLGSRHGDQIAHGRSHNLCWCFKRKLNSEPILSVPLLQTQQLLTFPSMWGKARAEGGPHDSFMADGATA
jgi:hypothetical protein